VSDKDLPTGEDLSRLYVSAKARSKEDKVFAQEALKHVLEFQKENNEASFSKRVLLPTFFFYFPFSFLSKLLSYFHLESFAYASITPPLTFVSDMT